MAGTFLRLLVVLLTFAQLICLNAVPITRTRSLMHGFQGHEVVLENTHLANTEKRWEMKATSGRMDVELSDYLGPGANNRHTPFKPPPAGKLCGVENLSVLTSALIMAQTLFVIY